jgi:hypothetical protein
MRRDRNILPPMGQGLAVVVSVVVISFAALVAVGMYVTALHIQARRQAVAAIDKRIAAERQNIHALEYELEIRSRFTQLGRWRVPLGLGPIGIDQRAADPRDLAARTAQRRANAATVLVDATPRRASYTSAARSQMNNLITAMGK